jgi:hypothetical protein
LAIVKIEKNDRLLLTYHHMGLILLDLASSPPTQPLPSPASSDCSYVLSYPIWCVCSFFIYDSNSCDTKYLKCPQVIGKSMSDFLVKFSAFLAHLTNKNHLCGFLKIGIPAGLSIGLKNRQIKFYTSFQPVLLIFAKSVRNTI